MKIFRVFFINLVLIFFILACNDRVDFSTLNKNNVAPIYNVEGIQRDVDKVIITGWVTDSVNNSFPSAIYLEIGGEMHKGDCRMSRGDVVAAYKNQNFELSGFRVEAPISPTVKNGILKVISNDAKSYYEIPVTIPN